MFTFASCDPDPVEPPIYQYPQDGPGLNVDLDLSFDGEDAVLFQEYENVLGQQMSLETIKFYLSDIRLVKENGVEEVLSDIEIFDVTAGRISAPLDAPVGVYAGLRFNVGVPQSLNGTDNPDFETFIYQDGHPLASNNGMYWAWQTGYRFFIFDGRVDTLGASPDDVPLAFSIHMGTDATLLPISVEADFEISGNDRHTATMGIDLSKCIYTDSDTLDLSDPFEANFHGGANIDLALRFREMLNGAIDVQID